MADLQHGFWKAVRGEVPPPPCLRLLGWRNLEAEPDSGHAKAEFDVHADLTNPTGSVMGGFVAAMLDASLGDALATTFEKDEFAPTLELKVNFIAATKPGRILGEGRVVKRGRSIAFLEGELRDASGELLATATATCRLVKLQPQS